MCTQTQAHTQIQAHTQTHTHAHTIWLHVNLTRLSALISNKIVEACYIAIRQMMCSYVKPYI